MTDSPTEPPPTKPRAHHYELRIRHLGRARWDWVFKADNGRTLAKSSEEYRRRRTAEHGARVTLGIEPDNREAFHDGEIVHRGTDPVPVRVRLR